MFGEYLSVDMLWKDKGVYLMIGGVGGFGFIFVNEIVN